MAAATGRARLLFIRTAQRIMGVKLGTRRVFHYRKRLSSQKTFIYFFARINKESFRVLNLRTFGVVVFHQRDVKNLAYVCIF